MSHLHVADCAEGFRAVVDGTVFFRLALVLGGNVHFLATVRCEFGVAQVAFVRFLLCVCLLMRLEGC